MREVRVLKKRKNGRQTGVTVNLGGSVGGEWSETAHSAPAD
jgi:hypothetical protein